MTKFKLCQYAELGIMQTINNREKDLGLAERKHDTVTIAYLRQKIKSLRGELEEVRKEQEL